MKTFLFISVIIFFIITFATITFATNEEEQATEERDVCILGAGASGMSAAVFLKDKQYDVLVIERKNRVGGNVNTYRLNEANWRDVGAQQIYNTSKLQLLGVGSFSVNSEQFVRRFTNKMLLPFTSIANPSYGADFKEKSVYPFDSNTVGTYPVVTPTPQFNEAFSRYLNILFQYPWLNTGNYPDNLPPELSLSFNKFVVDNNLTALNQVFNILLVRYRNRKLDFQDSEQGYSALSGIQDSNLALMFDFISPPNGFRIQGGNENLYIGIKEYLGDNNVWLNTNVLNVDRTNSNHVKIIVTRNNQQKTVKCRKLIVSYPPLVDNMKAFDLTNNESLIFKDLNSFLLYPFVVDINSNVGPYSCIYNLNSSNEYYYPQKFPFVNYPCRLFDNEGPAVASVITKQELTNEQVKDVISEQLSGLDSLFCFRRNQISFINKHLLTPYFTKHSLSQSPNPYERMRQIQGNKNTFYLGSSFTLDFQHTNWNTAYLLINQYF